MDALDLRRRAEELYRSGQFLCSEAIVYAFNEALGNRFPPEVVRLASGFPIGMGAVGTGGCVCGALAGGIMVLGMIHGRSNPGDKAPLILQKAKELHDWFESTKHATCCRVLIHDLEFGSPTHIDQCVSLTGDVAEYLTHMIDGK